MTANINRFNASFALSFTNASSLPFVLKSTRGIIKFAKGTTQAMRNDQWASEANDAFGSSFDGDDFCSLGTEIFAIVKSNLQLHRDTVYGQLPSTTQCEFPSGSAKLPYQNSSFLLYEAFPVIVPPFFSICAKKTFTSTTSN